MLASTAPEERLAIRVTSMQLQNLVRPLVTPTSSIAYRTTTQQIRGIGHVAATLDIKTHMSSAVQFFELFQGQFDLETHFFKVQHRM
jgi:hypothetical protein